MPAKAINGKVVFRNWDQHSGLDETVVSFGTLDDLFELCLQDNDLRLVDRVIIQGLDAHGNQRTVTLEFQSVTVSNHRPPEP